MTNFINKLFDIKQINPLKRNGLFTTNSNFESLMFPRLSVVQNTNDLISNVSQHPNYKEILIVADRTKETVKSIKAAIEFKIQAKQEIKIKLLHVVDMTPMDRYYSIGMSSSFGKILLQNKKQEFLNFLIQQDIDYSFLSIKVKLVKGAHVMEDVYDNIQLRKPDLVLLGKQSFTELNKYLSKQQQSEKKDIDVKHPVIIMR